MKKRYHLFVPIMLFFLTLSGCSSPMLSSGDTVTIPKKEYEELKKKNEQYQKIEFLRSEIDRYFLFDVDEDKIQDGIYKGIFMGLDDPYSQYYNPSEYKKLMEDSQGEFAGIGITVSPAEGDFITVIAPIAGTPGERAGIRPGDQIIKVDGELYYSDTMDKAVEKMRGEPGTDVTITIRRDENGEFREFDTTITREMIVIHSVKHQMMDQQKGYIEITSFDANTAKDFKTAINDLIAQGADGVVIDLRNNPGGLLDVTVEIADYLLPEAEIVSTMDAHGREEFERSGRDFVDVPLTVLINKGSASASEILSGALKDNERAVVVGTQSFGKGIVQRVFPMGDGSGYKITISEYHTPSGVQINGVGIKPDIEIDLADPTDPIGPDHLDTDTQLMKALEQFN